MNTVSSVSGVCTAVKEPRGRIGFKHFSGEERSKHICMGEGESMREVGCGAVEPELGRESSVNQSILKFGL